MGKTKKTTLELGGFLLEGKNELGVWGEKKKNTFDAWKLRRFVLDPKLKVDVQPSKKTTIRFQQRSQTHDVFFREKLEGNSIILGGEIYLLSSGTYRAGFGNNPFSGKKLDNSNAYEFFGGEKGVLFLKWKPKQGGHFF